jgi:hypothetical protein
MVENIIKTMENKQTAVEWFYQRILAKDIKSVFEQALVMEKEQHEKTYSKGWTTRERFDDLVPDIIYPEGLDYEEKQEYAFEKYYNEHYGK